MTKKPGKPPDPRSHRGRLQAAARGEGPQPKPIALSAAMQEARDRARAEAIAGGVFREYVQPTTIESRAGAEARAEAAKAGRALFDSPARLREQADRERDHAVEMVQAGRIDEAWDDEQAARRMEGRARRLENPIQPAPRPKIPANLDRASPEAMRAVIDRHEAERAPLVREIHEAAGAGDSLRLIDALAAAEKFDERDNPARASVRELRAELLNFVSGFPCPADYAHYFLAFVVPKFNATNPHFRLCEVCGRRFGLLDGRTENGSTCSEGCRKKRGVSVSKRRRKERPTAELEALLDERTKAVDLHRSRCKVAGCYYDTPCPTLRPLVNLWAAARNDLAERLGGDAMNQRDPNRDVNGNRRDRR